MKIQKYSKIISVALSFSMIMLQPLTVRAAYETNSFIADISNKEIDVSSDNDVSIQLTSETNSDNQLDDQSKLDAFINSEDTISSNAVSSNTVSSNVWDLIRYSGKEPIPMKASDGKYYIVKGTKFFAGNGGGTTSSDKKTFKVNKKGYVKAKKGSATITSEKYGTIDVSVISPRISSKKESLQVGDNTQLSLSGVPDGLPVSWISSDQNVIQVYNGKCVAVGIGKATVTAYVTGKGYKCKINVKDKENSTLLYNVGTEGKPVKIKGLKGKPTFAVSDNSVAIENNSIRISSSKKTPVSGNASDGHKLLIYLNDTKPVSNNFDLKIGEKAYIFSDNCHEFPDFKSKTPSIATVSERGVIIGQAPGTTKIQAKIRGQKISLNVTVSDEIYKGPELAKRNIIIIDPINNNTSEPDNTEVELYTVTFDSNGGSVVEPQIINKGSKATKPENPTKEKSVFNGWNYESYLYSFTSKVEDDITLTAEWQDDKNEDGVPDSVVNSEGVSTVVLDLNGGTFDSVLNGDVLIKHVNNGESIPYIIPKRENCEFIGWYYQSGEEYIEDSVITSDTVLIAYWKDKLTNSVIGQQYVYAIINDSFGYIYNIKANKGDTITPPVIKRNGYRFDHYKYEDGTTYKLEDTFSESKILYAVWEPTESKNVGIVVSFNPRNGEEIFKQVVSYNGLIEAPTDPSYTGYSFKSWYYDGQAFSFTTPVRTDIDLYAEYDENQYVINYDANGATGAKESEIIKYSDRVYVNSTGFENPGYKFVGYSRNRNATTAEYGSGTYIKRLSDEDGVEITLYAIWEATPVNYTVIHKQQDINSSSYTEVEREEFSAMAGTSVTPDIKTYTGFTSPTAKQTVSVNGDGSTVVNYEYTRNQYDLTLLCGDNVTSVDGNNNGATHTYYYDEPITLTAVLRDSYDDDEYVYNDTNDYRYKGRHTFQLSKWDNAGTSVNANFKMPARNTTLTAIAEENDIVDNEQYKVEITKGNNIISVSPVAGTYWKDKGDSITVTADYDDNYIATGTGDYTINKPYRINVTGIRNNITISWNRLLESSVSSNYLDPTVDDTRDVLVNKISDATYSGWTAIRYIDTDGNIQYASPYEIGSINPRPGTGVYFVQVSKVTDDNDKYEVIETLLFIAYTSGEIDPDDIHNLLQKDPNATEYVAYKVIHRKQKLDLSGFDAYETYFGHTPAYKLVSPEVEEYEGFTSPERVSAVVSPDGSTEIVYDYLRKSHNITITTTGVGINNVVGSGSYLYGERVYLNAVSDNTVIDDYTYDMENGYRYKNRHDYSINEWKNVSSNEILGNSASIDLIMGDSDIALAVNGVETVSRVSEEYRLATNKGAGVRYVTLSPEPNDHSVWFNKGTVVDVGAIYEDHWQSVSNNGTGTYTVDHEIELTITAAPIEYTVEYESNGATSVAGIPSKSFKWGYGGSVVLATPGNSMFKQGYAFDSWNTKRDGTGDTYQPGDTYNIPANVSMYAQWVPIDYTITFDLNGADGQVPVSINNVHYGISNTNIPITKEFIGANKSNKYQASAKSYDDVVISREGYSFKGWCKSADGNDSIYGLTYLLTGLEEPEITLYAIWEKVDYDITWDYAGGSVTRTVPAKYNIDSDFLLPGNGVIQKLVINGNRVYQYQLLGWEVKDEDGNDAVDSLGNSIATTGGIHNLTSDGKVFGPLTCTALWSTNGVDLSARSSVDIYIDYGADNIEYISKSFASNKTEVLNPMFDILDDYSTEIPDGFTYSGTKSESSDTRELKRTGYTLTRWTANGGSLSTEIENNKKTYYLDIEENDIVLHARWKANDYTVTFNANSGSCSTANKVVTYKSTYGTLPTASRIGYTFAGWFTEQSSGTQITSSSVVTTAGEHTLYAHWTPNTNTKYVVYHQIEGLDGKYTTNRTENLTGTTGASVTPARESYTGFTAPAGQTITIKADGTSTVTYKYTRNYYTVTVNKGTGISATSGGGSKKYGATVTVGYSLATGYDFSKWTGDETTATFTMPASNVTMTANGVVHNYSITYNYNGGSLPSGKSNPSSYNITTATFTINNPTRSYYTFAGWTGSNGSTKQTSVSITKGSTGNKSYTANWTGNSYTVKFNANGGNTPSKSSMSVTYGSKYGTLATCTKNNATSSTDSTQTETKYDFDGWYDKPSGGSKIVSTSTVAITGTTTLYAHWTPHTRTKTRSWNAGTEGSYPSSVTVGGSGARSSDYFSSVTLSRGSSSTPKKEIDVGFASDGSYVYLKNRREHNTAVLSSVSGSHSTSLPIEIGPGCTGYCYMNKTGGTSAGWGSWSSWSSWS